MSMFKLFEPYRGHIYRVAFITDSPPECDLCFHPEVGFFHPDSPAHLKFSMPYQDPELEGKALTYRMLPVLMWDLGSKGDRPLFTKETIPQAKPVVWPVQPWMWEVLTHHWKSFPPGDHDYELRCMDHRPWVHLDASPRLESLISKFEAATDRPVAQSVAALYARAGKVSLTFNPGNLIPHYEIEDLRAIFGVRQALAEGDP